MVKKEIYGCIICGSREIKTVKKGKNIRFHCLSCGKVNDRHHDIVSNVKVRNTRMGKAHYSAGALVEKDGKYLITKRVYYPFLYNVVGGHVDKGETMREAVIREVKEETGLKVKKLKLLYKGMIDPDICTRGADRHYWNLFLAEADGRLKVDMGESAGMRWLTKRQMARLKFIPPTAYIFKKLKFFKEVK